MAIEKRADKRFKEVRESLEERVDTLYKTMEALNKDLEAIALKNRESLLSGGKLIDTSEIEKKKAAVKKELDYIKRESDSTLKALAEDSLLEYWESIRPELNTLITDQEKAIEEKEEAFKRELEALEKQQEEAIERFKREHIYSRDYILDYDFESHKAKLINFKNIGGLEWIL